MAHTFHELKKKKVTELREIAKTIEHEAVQGYTQVNKEHLLAVICKALNLDMFEHHKAVGIDKTVIKKRIKALKKKRDESAVKGDKKEHADALTRIHKLDPIRKGFLENGIRSGPWRRAR